MQRKESSNELHEAQRMPLSSEQEERSSSLEDVLSEIGFDGEFSSEVEDLPEAELNTRKNNNVETAMRGIRELLTLGKEDELRRTVEELIKRSIQISKIIEQNTDHRNAYYEQLRIIQELKGQRDFIYVLLALGSGVVTFFSHNPNYLALTAIISLEIFRLYKRLKPENPKYDSQNGEIERLSSEIKVGLEFLGVKTKKSGLDNSFIKKLQDINTHRRMIGEEYYEVDEFGEVFIVEKRKVNQL